MENTFIYSLSDPITGFVRYIGKSDNVRKRFSDHFKPSSINKNTYKNNWLKKIRGNGLIPIIDIIDEVSKLDWKFWEIHYISLYKSWGFPLVNLTNGGDGCDGYRHSQEVIKKLKDFKIDKMKGENNPFFNKKHSPETITIFKQIASKRPKEYYEKTKHIGLKSWNKGLTSKDDDRIKKIVISQIGCKKKKNPTSDFFNVYLDKKNKAYGAKYTAHITVNSERIILGYFPNTHEGEILAAKAYDKKALEIYGNNVRLNFNING